MQILNKEDLSILQEVARKISQKELLPLANVRDENYTFSKEAFRKLGATGFTGMLIPKFYNGFGGPLPSLILVLEELAKGCASTALSLLTHIVAAQSIADFGTEEQKTTFLPSLAAGETIAAFAIHEGASGAVAGAIETRAREHPNHYLINGSKFFVTNGGVADIFVILVRTCNKEKESLSLVLVEASTAKLTIGKQDKRMGMNSTASTEIFFDDCQIPKSNLLGEAGKGVQYVLSVVSKVGLPGMSSIALGLAQAALDSAIKHSKDRIIAGQPIGQLAAIQFLLADMKVTVEAMRGMLHYSLQSDESTLPLATKLFVTERAVEVIDKSLQVHGGHGYSKEMSIERYYREARGLKLHFMTSEILKANIAKKLLGI